MTTVWVHEGDGWRILSGHHLRAGPPGRRGGRGSVTGLTRRTFLKAHSPRPDLRPARPHWRNGAVSLRNGGATAAGSPRRDERVLIIGAGMAGLAAAAELRALGFEDVAILEARDRIGGRIWTDAIGGNIPVDLGASWIHGVDGNPITAIATGNGIATHPTDYDNDVVHFHDAERPSPSARRPCAVSGDSRSASPTPTCSPSTNGSSRSSR